MTLAYKIKIFPPGFANGNIFASVDLARIVSCLHSYIPVCSSNTYGGRQLMVNLPSSEEGNVVTCLALLNYHSVFFKRLC